MCIHLRARSSVRGFSLLELMIVLGLMVGLLAIAWPNMQRPLRRTTLNEAAQVLREAIDEGRHEAITTGEPIFVQMQQGNHEVRTGSFANFENADESGNSFNAPKLDSHSNSIALTPDAFVSMRQGLGVETHAEGRAPRTWRLPESIVITEVNWTSDVMANEIETGAATSGLDSAVNDTVSAIDPIESVVAIAALETANSDWWLPISATGQSRSASIVLYDTSIHEKLTVNYSSATGALEIVR